MFRETSTISKNADGTYNLLLKNERGRVVIHKKNLSLQEAVYELEMAMYARNENESKE